VEDKQRVQKKMITLRVQVRASLSLSLEDHGPGEAKKEKLSLRGPNSKKKGLQSTKPKEQMNLLACTPLP